MNEELAAEDLFRLNILLTQDVKAVRIDESRSLLLALTSQGEASMPLNPTCRPERYFRLLREQLSGHALGSPSGYPIHLSRWTRHGQMASENLGRLLLTGESEAVVAVVHSPSLTDEIAGYAWWAMPTIENAQLMLSRQAVAEGAMGSVLAEFLVEHLPFLQDDHLAIIDTVATLIYSRTLTQAQREAVWKRGKRQNTHYIAFLEMCHDNLPCPIDARADFAAIQARLAELESPTGLSSALLRALSAQGQTFLAATQEVLERPETQEVVNYGLNSLGRYFTIGEVADLDSARQQLLAMLPELADDIEAVIALSQASKEMTYEIFSRSSAIGSLMRRKIEPIVAPLLTHIRQLRHIRQ